MLPADVPTPNTASLGRFGDQSLGMLPQLISPKDNDYANLKKHAMSWYPTKNSDRYGNDLVTFNYTRGANLK